MSSFLKFNKDSKNVAARINTATDAEAPSIASAYFERKQSDLKKLNKKVDRLCERVSPTKVHAVLLGAGAVLEARHLVLDQGQRMKFGALHQALEQHALLPPPYDAPPAYVDDEKHPPVQMHIAPPPPPPPPAAEDNIPARVVRGRLVLPDGRVLDGIPADYTGKGTFTFSYGDVYEGDFVNGKMTGKGKMTSSSLVYEGDFVDGVKEGHGCETDLFNGCIYEGPYHLNYPRDACF